jgi:SAM-dependent methyltransferase
MQFSELVAFQNHLDTLSISIAVDESLREIESILYSIESLGETVDQQFDQHVEILKAREKTIIENFESFEKELDTLKKAVNASIVEHEKFWFEAGDQRYNSTLSHLTTSFISERSPALTPEERTVFNARLSLYSAWENPGLIIRPMKELFIYQMVNNDPLYLVDLRQELLDPILDSFNPIYRNKLCTYVINENLDQEILKILPNNQFGLCLVYNFFNYQPLQVIEKYLSELYQKLRPGGVLVITYTDCDHWTGAYLVEKHVCCYTPGHLIKQIIQDIGYEILHTISNAATNTWVELKKPGTFISSRGGQLSALPAPKLETIELHRLRSIAREFNMATSEDIEQYTKRQLIKLIVESGKENLL